MKLEEDFVVIKISVPSMLQMFHPCTENYIKNVCKGVCCQGSSGIKVVVGKREAERISNLGAKIVDFFIVPDERGLCPFKNDGGFCNIHYDKPFGCKASPFILTNKNTLIVRNRYRRLRCFKAENSQPVYLAHKWSLVQIFGKKQYSKLGSFIENEEKGDLYLKLDRIKFDIFKENSTVRKRGRRE